MHLSLTIDGSHVEIASAAQATLADIVRDFCGDHIIATPCRSATCGACTVLSNGAPVLSCITPASLCTKIDVVTAAGLAHDSRLASLRRLFADPLIQACGACASGLSASCAALLNANPRPTRDDVRHALAGHTCLCIGYGPILDAVTEHRADMSFAPSAGMPHEPLPTCEDIAEALAQERRVVGEKIDPLVPMRATLQSRAAVAALNNAADAFGWTERSAAKDTQRQVFGSWVAQQGTAENAAVVFVALEVDSETDIVTLRRVMTLLNGALENTDAVAESGVMRGIFAMLRPVADATQQFFPEGFPTSIDLPEIVHVSSADDGAPRNSLHGLRQQMCLATIRAIAGALHDATGSFPDHTPYAPPWSRLDLDNASNIS